MSVSKSIMAVCQQVTFATIWTQLYLNNVHTNSFEVCGPSQILFKTHPILFVYERGYG